MTLITYPTRVHFADDVLQEALHSELERARCSAPLLICDASLGESEFADRILEGLPRGAQPQHLYFTDASDLRQSAAAVCEQAVEPDVLIAFGSARAIELSRKCRYALTQRLGRRPPLYAVPGVDGMPGPCTRNVESWRAGLPSVLICDPTVTLNSAPEQSLRSVVLSLVRCVESYLAQAYNPPADGMALDGIGRCLINLPQVGQGPVLDQQREVMAACLNAALAQEKGVGPALTLAHALTQAQDGLEEVELARLLLPEAIRHTALDARKVGMLMKVLGGSETSLDASVAALLGPVPMHASLSELGVRRESVEDAAQKAAGKAGLDVTRARRVLEAVF